MRWRSCSASTEPEDDDWDAFDWRHAFDKLRGFGFEQAIVTLGGDGSVVLDGTADDPEHRIQRIAPVRVKAVDTTGCGDSFMGTVLAGLASGTDVVRSPRNSPRMCRPTRPLDMARRHPTAPRRRFVKRSVRRLPMVYRRRRLVRRFHRQPRGVGTHVVILEFGLISRTEQLGRQACRRFSKALRIRNWLW